MSCCLEANVDKRGIVAIHHADSKSNRTLYKARNHFSDYRILIPEKTDYFFIILSILLIISFAFVFSGYRSSDF